MTSANEKMSEAGVTGWPISCSGAAHSPEYMSRRRPATTWVSPARLASARLSIESDLAMPKSASLGERVRPLVPNRMFFGLMSRWMMSCPCASSSAPQIAATTCIDSAGASGPSRRTRFDSVPPFMNSETWNGAPASCPSVCPSGPGR